MHVGQLLDLEGSLQAGGEAVAATHDQQRLLLGQPLKKTNLEIPFRLKRGGIINRR